MKFKVKRTVVLILSAVLGVGCMSGCGKQSASKGFDSSNEITIMSREDGSGTRGAFIELFGVEQKNESGEKVDYTTDEAIITNSTSVMMTNVAGDTYSIGYISLGSLNETVKAVEIDGKEATVSNIKSGDYSISRPFIIATKAEISEAAQDFVDFIMSADGQKVVEENGYIAVSDAPAYDGRKPDGKIVVAGSSSVTPVMEKLKEAYLKVNTNAEVQIQESDSTTGVTSAIEGICDIGMSSRALKDSETAEGITGTIIALDGIAVIVNKENTIDNLTQEQVMEIYTGELTKWSDVMSE